MKESETETNRVDIVFECFKEIGSELSAIAIANANFRRRYNLESLKIMVFYAVIKGWKCWFLCVMLYHKQRALDKYMLTSSLNLFERCTLKYSFMFFWLCFRISLFVVRLYFIPLIYNKHVYNLLLQ